MFVILSDERFFVICHPERSEPAQLANEVEGHL